MASPIIWRFDRFLELSVHDLYDVLRLRSEVFVVEQRCIFQDMDGSDDQAIHLLGRRDGRLLAYARCFPSGVKYAEASIGRIVTHPQARGLKLGHDLLSESVARLCKAWGVQPIRIGAQARLQHFYEGHGFVVDGPHYDEDGIDHVQMLWRP